MQFFKKKILFFLFLHSDGTTQLLSGCLRDFRNKPFPTRARVEYYRNTLTILFHNGMTNNNEDYEMCMRAEGVVLPKNGYFGISAATGGLADDHDVFHFLTTSLHDPSKLTTDPTKIDEADQMKLAQEYEDYQKKLDAQKEEYRKEHPDENKGEPEDWFETDNQRELRQIYHSQKQMLDHIKDLSSKMDEVVGRQERTMGLLSTNANGVQQSNVAGGGGGSIGAGELGTVLNNQHLYMATVREIRAIVGELQIRADTILQNQAKQPTAQIHSAGYDMQSIMNEMRDGMNQVKQGIAAVSNK